MLQFSANLSMLFTEVPLVERFALAKQHGFDAVEIQFPYELTIDELNQQLALNKQQLVLINVPAGDLMQGGDGLASVPGREYEFRQAVFQAIRYASALHVPTVNILAGRQSIHADLLPCLQTLSKNLRFASTEMSSAPIIVPTTVPAPPKRDAPPITTAATVSSTSASPALAAPLVKRVL